MPQKHLILWTQTAQKDLKGILDYLNNDSTSAAAKIFQQIKEACKTLENFPQQGRIVPELSALHIQKYRELRVKRWRIIYKSESKTVFIVSVIDEKRNAEDILLDRFQRD